MTITKKSGYNPEIDFNEDSNGITISRVEYLVNDDFSDGMEYRIRNSGLLPFRGDPYPDANANLVVDRVSISPYNNSEDGEYKNWKATITYAPPSGDENEGSDGAFQQNLQVSARTQQYEVPLEVAFDEENKETIPVQSTTFEPLIGVTKFTANLIIDISQNLARFPFSNLTKFKNSTNATNRTIVGVPVEKDKARILDISATSNVDSLGNKYYAVSYSIEITDVDFLVKPMNRGFKAEINSSELTYIRKKDVSDETGDTGEERIDEPAKIGAKGSENAAEGSSYPENQIITDAGADYLAFKAHKSENWNTLEIPTAQP